MDRHRILQFTSALLILPALYYSDTLLSLLLLLTFCFSQMFWSNPIQGSTIHQCDAIIAKCVIAVFVCLTPWSPLYIFILGCMAVAFYYSHTHSSVSWCCEPHLFYHGLLHMFSAYAATFAFIS